MTTHVGGKASVYLTRPRRLDRYGALNLLRLVARESGSMRDLRALFAQELRGAAIHDIADGAVLERLADLIASGALTVAVLDRPSPPTPPYVPDLTVEMPPPIKEPPKKKKWFDIELVDDGDPPMPIAGARYRVELPDGRVIEGQLDGDGKARVEVNEPSTCKVTFPDFDDKEWAKT